MWPSPRKAGEHLAAIDATIAANDRSYQQRWQADQQAVKDALTAQEKAVNAALAAAEKAVGKAEEAANDRFHAANNVKAELDRKYSELLADAVTRPEFETFTKDVLKRIEDVNIALSVLRQEVAVGSPAVKVLQDIAASDRGGDAATEALTRRTLVADEARFQRFAMKIYLALGAGGLVVTLSATHVIK